MARNFKDLSEREILALAIALEEEVVAQATYTVAIGASPEPD